ncbi:MAG: hypothetical protein ACKVOB_03380 [Sphingomonas sp.]
MTARRDEAGYALIAAVASIAFFALVSLMMIEATRGTVMVAGAELSRARLLAAADAGVAIALQDLMQPNPISKVPINGSARELTYDRYLLRVAVDDERGKIALNQLNKQQVEVMFSGFGVQGAALEEAVDGFLDWRDEDDSPRARGAEDGEYAARGIVARNGPLKTVGELALIHGVGPALAARMAPVVTLNFGLRGEFDPRTASAIARRVMIESDADGASAADAVQVREATSLGDSNSLIGRPLTIRVEASDGQGGHARRRLIIELAGADGRTYFVRARD